MEHVAGVVVRQPQGAFGRGGAAIGVMQGLEGGPEGGAGPHPVEELLDVGHLGGEGDRRAWCAGAGAGDRWVEGICLHPGRWA
jgi:hypothetical protein